MKCARRSLLVVAPDQLDFTDAEHPGAIGTSYAEDTLILLSLLSEDLGARVEAYKRYRGLFDSPVAEAARNRRKAMFTANAGLHDDQGGPEAEASNHEG